MSGRSLTGARWAPVQVDGVAVERFAARGHSPVAARCLAARWPEVDDLDALTPDLAHLHDPASMDAMDAAVDRLDRALRDGQHLRIITDYDVDGTTSSLILQAALRVRRPDAHVSYHIPSRFGEGYGFSTAAADAAIADGVDLVVTADIGVRDHAAISRARSGGVDVLVCDHHLPPGTDVPTNATVLCPPKAGCTYPNPFLAACGISLKVAEAMLARHPKRDAIVRSMLKLAAIGTVADMVSLRSQENRAIVALGLAELNRGPHHAGLVELLKVARLEAGEIDEGSLGFRIGPRINAAGRLADANLVVRLLSERDPARAAELAARIDALNRERRNIQGKLTEQALASIPDPPPAFVVVSGPEEDGWHRGVVGIVASRVKDEVHRPAAVVSIQGDYAVGSVRSVPSVHAVKVLDACADLLVKYGGHPAAAGFTVRTADLPALTARLADEVYRHTDDLVPVRDIDAELPLEDAGLALIDELARFGPYGQGNPTPHLLVRDVDPIGGPKRMGGDGKHLKLWLPRPGGGRLDAVWFGQGALADDLQGHRLDLLGKLSANTWRGQTRPQIEVVDARISEG